MRQGKGKYQNLLLLKDHGAAAGQIALEAHTAVLLGFGGVDILGIHTGMTAKDCIVGGQHGLVLAGLGHGQLIAVIGLMRMEVEHEYQIALLVDDDLVAVIQQQQSRRTVR